MVGLDRERLVETLKGLFSFTDADHHVSALGPGFEALRIRLQQECCISQCISKAPLLDTDGRAIDQSLWMIRTSAIARSRLASASSNRRISNSTLP